MRQRGQALIIFVVVVLVLALIGLFAVCTPGEDDHGLGRVQLVSHERHRCYDDCDDRDDDRGGKQTCFMACYIVVPSPLPGGDKPPPEDRPESLVPPTPDKIIQGIQTMGDAGIKLGSTIAQLVIDYVVTVFRFLV